MYQILEKEIIPLISQIHHAPQSSIGEEVFTTIVDDGRRLAGDEVITGFIDGTGDEAC